MRSLTTSFAILLALIAYGSGVTNGAPGVDTGTNLGVGPVGVAGAPALPPVPVPVAAPIVNPAPQPAPGPTLAPAPAFIRSPGGPVRDGLGNPGVIQAPIAVPSTGVSSVTNTPVAAGPQGEQWRYRWHNNNWWYWTPENRWIYRNGNDWTNYEPTVTFAPGPGADDGQPTNGTYVPAPSGDDSRPYAYSTGYRGNYYYSPGYRRAYYGSGRYYGGLGISIGTRRGGFGIGF